MKRLWTLAFLTIPALFVPACGDSVDANTEYAEPLRFRYQTPSGTSDAQFFPGEPPTASAGPDITGVDYGSLRVFPGIRNRSFSVRTALTAYSIAIRVQGRTNGYWLARVGDPDPVNGGLATDVFFDVATTMPPGAYNIELSALDGDQHVGATRLAPMQVVPRIDPNQPAIITLKWDAAVDLDLQVRAPDGTFLSPKSPTTAPRATPDAGASGYGLLQGDSVANCVDDGLREEDVVFAAPPIPGLYQVYVNAFSLCGRPGSNYEVVVTRNGVVDQSYFGNISAPQVQQAGYQVGDYIADVTF